jgi:DNA-binding transcriptional LysR family regulator
LKLIFITSEIHIMNIAGLDLNLLIVFDAVMSERNATRAGHKIGMSQPAVSNALNRLRHTLKDDLFVRGPDGMRPTARALELAVPIRCALTEIESALNPTDFDPATAERTFIMAVNDYASMTLMPYISTYISNEAPGVNVHTIPIEGQAPFRKLDSQQAEYGIFPLEETPERYNTLNLGGDKFVCMMRRDHPLANHTELPIEEYANARHLLVSPRGDPRGFVDEQLDRIGKKRRVVMTVNNFGSAPMIVLSSDMIVSVPSRLAEKCGNFFDMHVVSSPIQPPTTITGMVLFWHNRLNNHPAHTWFQGIMQRAADDLATYGMDHYLTISKPGQ